MKVAKVLDTLSQGLGRPRPSQAAPKPVLKPSLQARRQRMAREDLLETFVANAQARGTQVHTCTRADLPSLLGEILSGQEPGPLMAPNPKALEAWGLDLAALGREVLAWEQGGDFPSYRDRGALAPVSLSPALAGVAHLGMVLQAVDPSQPRSLSLLPPVHFCLLAASGLAPSIASALDLCRDQWNPSSQVLFVAGPSSTGDIENVIVTGVHGPVEEVLFLVTDA